MHYLWYKCLNEGFFKKKSKISYFSYFKKWGHFCNIESYFNLFDQISFLKVHVIRKTFPSQLLLDFTAECIFKF